MSEKSAPAEGIENTTEDQTGEVKQTLGAAGVHEQVSPPRPQKAVGHDDAGRGSA